MANVERETRHTHTFEAIFLLWNTGGRKVDGVGLVLQVWRTTEIQQRRQRGTQKYVCVLFTP